MSAGLASRHNTTLEPSALVMMLSTGCGGC
jgi:hypothetical protein